MDKLPIVERLRDDCRCADNVDAEQNYDGTWSGTFGPRCDQCQAASVIEALVEALEPNEEGSALYNLMGAIADIEAGQSNNVTLETLNRVLGQLSAARKVIDLARSKTDERA